MESMPFVRIAVVESDPVRLMGYRALFESEPGFNVVSSRLSEIGELESDSVVLLGNCSLQNLFDSMASMKAIRPDLRIIVTGSGAEEMILNSLVAGAKGYVDETALPAEFLHAVRVVSQGLVWAPRHVFTMFIERSTAPGRMSPSGRAALTSREKDVLQLLVGGRSNREIGSPLGIQERTVKAHVAKLMRKVGVHNRIALSVHAVTHSLVRIETPFSTITNGR
jgi:DNA-binding NarL/FixJ family response regulator